MTGDNILALIDKMTLEEKAGMCSGKNWFETKDVERLGIPRIQMFDGPNGLRKNAGRSENDNFGGYTAVKSTCFPTGSAMAASWDVDLLYEIGQKMGEECQTEQVPLLLGPAINMKRSPLCGRNFEYLSEDPYLGGKLAAALVKGIQSQGVGACLKHFAANNQEYRRLSVNSIIDEQTLREIYLTAFEIAVKEASPLTIMCAYNMINGTHCCENKHILNDILREEWGFEGIVISDWGAMNHRVESLAAGLELEMPYSGPENDSQIISAVKSGELSEDILNRSVYRLLKFIFKVYESKKKSYIFNNKEHHHFARKAASECMVLLKNSDSLLPLKANTKIALIGEMAEFTRYQGGGSSHVTATCIDNILTEMKSKTGSFTYAKGYSLSEDDVNYDLINEATLLAQQNEVAVIIAGLPDKYESEHYDRPSMKMPDGHVKLIEAVAKANPNTVVVLLNGSPVEIGWESSVKGILEAYLGGQATAGAICDILFGDVNPSGKLAESFPIKLEDNPSFLNYSDDTYEVNYHECVYIGYRYYDKKKMQVQYPFGFGLSYTTFSYSDIRVDKKDIIAGEEVCITVKIKNTGKVKGKEIVQLYTGPVCTAGRPVKELRAFKKVELYPGEEKTISFTLGKRGFAYYNAYISDWHVKSGKYSIYVGSSSRDIHLIETINIITDVDVTRAIDINTTLGDLLEDSRTAEVTLEMLKKHAPSVLAYHNKDTDIDYSAISVDMAKEMLHNMPLREARLFSKGTMTDAILNDFIIKLNNIINASEVPNGKVAH